MPVDIEALVSALTIDEKAALTAGADDWTTVAISRLGIPSVVLSDGPAGARGATVDHESLTPSVCIPSGTALGASWDPELVTRASAIVARQAREKGARVLLAPTVNLHRHPLWGRNFEGFSEDPLLTAKLAVAYIAGVQSQDVAAAVKHLVCNEVEHERFTCSSDVDERTLRECYLLPFEHAVRHAGVWTVMTSYNRVNGAHVPDDQRLLQDILRGEWGFEGLVMSDWWALAVTEQAAVAGLDLEMPGPARAFGPALAAAVEGGRVDEAHLGAKVRRLLGLLERLGLLDGTATSSDGRERAAVGEGLASRSGEHPQDRPEDRLLLREAAAGSLVLLANDGILPLAVGALSSVALVGPRSEHPSIMGGGSARVRPHYRLSLLDVLRERLGTGADIAVIVVGTDENVESEGYDRETMDLPGDQDELVRRVLAANPRGVVVVTSGAPVTMGWAEESAALLQSFFGGQEIANGLVDVLLGEVDPGGRLPTTLPVLLEHTPAFGNFPGEASHVRYGEGLLLGYRWYEARRLAVRFPFGHGLSYTTFAIGAPRCSSDKLEPGGRVQIEVPVRNTGDRRGSEVVQCYIAPPGGVAAPVGGRLRAAKELRGFAKVLLEPGEETTVTFDLGERSFAYYDAADEDWLDLRPRQPHPTYPPPSAHRDASGWYVAAGTYELLVGRSSVDIAQRIALDVTGGDAPLDPTVLPD